MTKYAKSCGPAKMADGGSVGFFERLSAGNIDDPKSEAYKRWGAGSKAAPAAAAPASDPMADAVSDNAASKPTKSEPTVDAPAEDAAERGRFDQRASDIGDKSPAKKSAPKHSAPRAAPKKTADTGYGSARSIDRQERSPSVGGGFASGISAGVASQRTAAAPTNEKQKVLSSSGLDPNTLLPLNRVNGGLIPSNVVSHGNYNTTPGSRTDTARTYGKK
jgi:hypothetical protein